MSQIFKSIRTIHFEGEYSSNYSIIVHHNSTGTGLLFKEKSVVWEMMIWQRNVHNPEGNQKDRCCRLSELLLNMKTKGHELKLENALPLKSASNSFAIALCGINSPEKI